MEVKKLKKSDETNSKQRDLAELQGDAYRRAVRHMIGKEAHDGAVKDLEEISVGVAVEKAEGMYMPGDEALQWEEPGEENVHVEVTAFDSMTGRFIPGLHITVTLVDEQGTELGTNEQPFLWHPWLYHYGRNWKVPSGGDYTIRVHIDKPDFMRHDKKNGNFFSNPVDVEFRGISIKPGKKG